MTTKHPIPDTALQQHIAVLGKNGSGKTYAAKAAIVEPLLEAKRRVVVVDPTGAWWGLRSSRDGRGPGFPVLVLGGDHGDMPLPANGGAAIARLATEQGVNLVADVSHLSIGERTRWFIAFADALFRTSKAPLHLVLDEAHNFAPQGGGAVRDPDVGKMLHAANQLAAGGRLRGIRLTMITQRPQKLHKDMLTSADALIAMRVIHPLDRGAVKDWIDGCGDPAKGKEVLDSLANLARGEGWVWYPEGGFLERMKFPQIRTFDSSATPAHGETIAAPKGAAEIDLAEIRAALADAVKEAEANDPRLLRARIAELERDAAKKPGKTPASAPAHAAPTAKIRAMRRALEEAMKVIVQINTKEFLKGEAIDKTAMEAAIQTATRSVASMVERHLDLRNKEFDALKREAQRVLARLQAVVNDDVEVTVDVRQNEPFTVTPAAAPKRSPGSGAGDSALGNSGKRRMLIALAQYQQLTPTKLSILTGISRGGGTWRTYLGELRSSGWAEGSDPIAITDAGLKALGPYEPLPTGEALIEYWRGRLGDSGKRKIFDAVIAKYPRGAAPEQIARETEIAIGGGTWRTYLGELRGLELITGRGELRASDDLFR